MAAHSSTLAWKIPWMEEPGRLQSMGSRRVGHDWATSLSLFTLMHWRRKWQPTAVFLSEESQGWGSLVGSCLSGCTGSDTTEATQQQQQQQCMYASPNLSIRPTFPLPPLCSHVHSLHLCLYSCHGNEFICTIFSRFHIYALIYDTCVSPSDFTLYDRL